MQAKFKVAPKAIDLKLRSGIRQRLWDHGGDGPCVLFLHGYLDTGRSFDYIADEAKSFCRPICLDWRGHGLSGRIGAGGSYHQLDLLKDLVQVIDLLGEIKISPSAMCAHSMGGAIALMLAGLMPEFCPSKVLILDNLGGFARDDDGIWERWVDLLESARKDKPDFKRAPSRQAAIERVLKNNPSISELTATRLVGALCQPTEAHEPDGEQEFQLDGRLRGPNPVKFTQEQWVNLSSRVTAQVWVIAPEGGYYPDFPEMRDRLDAIHHGREIGLANASHHLHLEHPNFICDRLRELLNNSTQ